MSLRPVFCSSDLRELREAATPGPWSVDDDWAGYGGDAGPEGSGWVTPHGAYSNNRADNELMALAPDLAQALEEAWEALRYIAGYDVAGMEGHLRSEDVARAVLAKLEGLGV